MGCDIHMTVEVLKKGKWTPVKQPKPATDSLEVQWYRPESWNWDFGRNYDSFAILANVRNGRGFAGIKTGSGFKPISEPRGLPEDRGLHGKNKDEAYGDHSQSWLLLSEVLACDRAQTVQQNGVVSDAQYAAWKKQKAGGPPSYSGGVSGPGIKMLPIAEMDLHVKKNKVQPNDDAGFMSNAMNYCEISWSETYAEAAQTLWEFVEHVQASIPGVPPDEIRLVFGFDS